jgi:hypothetical protein
VRQWTLEQAKVALPEVRAIVRRMRVLVRDSREHARKHEGGRGAPVAGNGHGPTVHVDDRELRALITELEARGIIVRDPARGLIDFVARSSAGEPYHLCWLDGEDTIEWWHWPDAGFDGRAPLGEAPD